MWRRWIVSRLQRTVCITVMYLIIFVVMFLGVTPEPPTTFVAERHRAVLPLLFLSSEAGAPFSDAAGADVFASRRCGRCFITNNRGFIPLADYDAVLVHGNRDLLSETTAFMFPGKRYLIETSADCVRSALRCRSEPRVTAFSSRKEFSLCSLCDELIKDKQKRFYSKTLYLEDTYNIF